MLVPEIRHNLGWTSRNYVALLFCGDGVQFQRGSLGPINAEIAMLLYFPFTLEYRIMLDPFL